MVFLLSRPGAGCVITCCRTLELPTKTRLFEMTCCINRGQVSCTCKRHSCTHVQIVCVVPAFLWNTCFARGCIGGLGGVCRRAGRDAQHRRWHRTTRPTQPSSRKFAARAEDIVVHARRACFTSICAANFPCVGSTYTLQDMGRGEARWALDQLAVRIMGWWRQAGSILYTKRGYPTCCFALVQAHSAHIERAGLIQVEAKHWVGPSSAILHEHLQNLNLAALAFQVWAVVILRACMPYT